jgi:hypothetical protein
MKYPKQLKKKRRKPLMHLTISEAIKAQLRTQANGLGLSVSEFVEFLSNDYSRVK